MWTVTIKGLLAHKLRLGLTALAIVLGVTFIAGTFVLTDTLHNVFNTLFNNIYQNVDFQVRGVSQFTTTGQGGNSPVRNAIPESILTTVRDVPGVKIAEGNVTRNGAQYIAKDGTAIGNGGAPNLGLSFDPNSQISPLRLVTGGDPTTSDDVVMDEGTAQKYHFSVGDRVRILLPNGVQTFTISGLARFGTANNLAGATLAAFNLPTAQRLFGDVGKLDAINVVAEPGANKSEVQHAIARVLPHGVEVVSAQTVVNENTSQINSALGFFSTALLVFGFIALFVGGFTILNTFSIIVGQRTRELALLRIVGASRRQVFRSVVGEAAIVGLISSLIGLGLGVLAALGLEALLSGFGITLPSGPLAFEARTVIVSLLVGVGVTVVAAISPARRAVRIPPVAAVSDHQVEDDLSFRRRFIWGAVITGAGALLLAIGLAKPAIQLVGLGAAAIFIGVARLAPAVARPMASAIGRPLARLLGMSGKLGRENSMRSPRRTAQTASALMVGLALVSVIAVFGASLSQSVTNSVNNALNADIIITSGNNGSGGFSNTVRPIAAAVPGVHASSTAYQDQFVVQGSVQSLTAVSTENLSQTVKLQMTDGSPASLATGGLLVDSTTADSKHFSVGQHIPVRFAKTGPTTMPVGGIFKDNQLIGHYLVGNGFFLSHFDNESPIAVLLATNGSAATEQAVKQALAAYPNLKIQSRAEYEQAQRNMVNQLLGLVYALLALAVIIALIGVVNTLMLSVFERTHEIGLLRAVGMKRVQIRAMIRSESVILSVFGAVIGIIIGTLLGIALSWSLKAQGITNISVPIPSLVIFLVLAAVLGLIAASWPARRAARLDVLAAIAAE
jgi:putative ABC transport system permease protein